MGYEKTQLILNRTFLLFSTVERRDLLIKMKEKFRIFRYRPRRINFVYWDNER